MQTRATKVFLPQSYQEYLAQKKKVNRLGNNNKLSGGNHDNLSNNNNQSSKQHNFSSNFQSSRTKKSSLNPSDSPLNNNFLPPSSNTNQQTLSQHGHDSDPQCYQNKNPNNKRRTQQTKIIQKIIYSQYKTLFEQFQNSKFQSIKSKIQQQLNKLQQSTPLQPIKVNEILRKFELQSLENIIQIEKQLKQPFGKRNPQKLDHMLNFNKFFIILNKEKRYRIYQQCALRKYEPGEIVYKQGELNENMYVVVKGCVKQYQTKSTSYQDKVEVNFVSYYEGSNFGEAPLVGDDQLKEKRYNTTVTTEETYLLLLSNNFYKQLITNSAEDDFQRKIQALMETTIFRDTSKIFVTPLLPTLTKHVLNYGTVLIRQGEQVRNLYFVAEGNLQVMLLDRAKRTVKHLNIQQKPKNFYTKRGQLPSSSQNKSRTSSTQNKKSYSIHTKFYYPQNTQGQNKEFLYGNKKLIGDNEMQYNQQVIFHTLRMGDFLGGKSFLQEAEREKKMMNSPYFDLSLNARLSVLSSSPKTIVYSLDEKKFFSLSDNFQKMLTQGIMQSKYFDEYNIQQKVSQQKDWKKYTQKIVSNVITAKKNSRSTSFRM